MRRTGRSNKIWSRGIGVRLWVCPGNGGIIPHSYFSLFGAANLILSPSAKIRGSVANEANRPLSSRAPETHLTLTQQSSLKSEPEPAHSGADRSGCAAYAMGRDGQGQCRAIDD